MSFVDPNQFVIARKRKKYKFAKFHNAENCFEFDEWRDFYQQRQPGIFGLEIGAGTGLFSVELAANFDHLITLYQRKLEKLQNIKKSMLEKMFV